MEEWFSQKQEIHLNFSLTKELKVEKKWTYFKVNLSFTAHWNDNFIIYLKDYFLQKFNFPLIKHTSIKLFTIAIHNKER